MEDQTVPVLREESEEDRNLRYALENWNRLSADLRRYPEESLSRRLCAEYALDLLADIVQLYGKRIKQLEEALDETQDQLELARDEANGGISDLDSRLGMVEEAVEDLTD